MVVTILCLLSLSIAVIYTSSPGQAIQQLIYGLMGAVFFFLLRNFDFRVLKSFVKPLYIIVTLLLIITFIIGFETRGSTRWIPLGLFNLQPSEFAKPVMIIALAAFWSKNRPTWLNLLKSIGILLPIWILIFRQPDLGTALTVLFAWLSILFYGQSVLH